MVEPQPSDPIPLADPHARGARWGLVVLAVLVVGVSLVTPLAAAGIWDPHELRVADLSRRIALGLLGAERLAVDGAVNSVPTAGELARGQLPFQSVALGFKLFGLHAWAGRLPLALWGILGVLGTWALLSRLGDRATGAIGALVLATMPHYFVHARTMLGDVVTMAACAIAVAGLAIASFDSDASAGRRLAWLLAGMLGLVAGFGSRGLLVGVAIPALAVGCAWLLGVLASARGPGTPLGRLAGLLALAIGLLALGVGLRVLFRAQTSNFELLLGAAVDKPRQLPTHDAVLHYLGHGLFPWSAAVPFAVGRLLARPAGVQGAAFDRESGLRASLLLAAAIGLGIQGAMAPVVGVLPFAPTFALAGIVAVAMRDLERGAPGSRTMGIGVAALAILFYVDFKNFPDKGLSAFLAGQSAFPDSFKREGLRLLELTTLGFAGVFLFSLLERQADAPVPFRRAEYAAWPKTLREAHRGNLMFTFLLCEAALAGFAALVFVAQRWPKLAERSTSWKQIATLSAQWRDIAAWGWIVLPVAVLVAPAGLMLLRDLVRWFYARAPLTRGLGATLAGVGAGLVMSLAYYPALAVQVSPKEVFEAYRGVSRPGEQLGLLGSKGGTASYYAGRNVPTFAAPNAAFDWLMERPNERRWLVIRSKDLAQVNSLYRARVPQPKNLPVLDARSSEILLASNLLAHGESNRNPLEAFVLDQPPAPARPLDGNFGGQLDALGWEVAGPDGKPVAAVVPGRPYEFRIYYKVVQSISGNWETFIHIDGFQRRFNGDLVTLEGKYPFHLWRVGDHIVDRHTFTLEPNFTPGDYNVFFGLFIGDRRLDVKRGRQHENRLEAGKLRVR